MSSREPVEVQLSGLDRVLFPTILGALGDLLGGTVVAAVLTDADGHVFVSPTPGIEREIMDVLAATDWVSLRRVIQEHLQ